MATSRETTAADAPVLVLWTGYRAGPWAVRSLRRAGHRVVAAHDAGRGSGGRSAAAPRPLRYPPPDADPEGFAAAVAAICRREGVRAVLPVSEAVTRGLALGTREEDLGGARIVGPDARQYAALCDKARLPAACASAGVDHPEQTVVGADGARAGDWPPLPSVVKPAGSSETLPGVPAAARVDTEGERRRVLDVFARAGVAAVVQEFVRGMPVAGALRTAARRLRGARSAGDDDLAARGRDQLVSRRNPRRRRSRTPAGACSTWSATWDRRA